MPPKEKIFHRILLAASKFSCLSPLLEGACTTETLTLPTVRSKAAPEMDFGSSS